MEIFNFVIFNFGNGDDKDDGCVSFEKLGEKRSVISL